MVCLHRRDFRCHQSELASDAILDHLKGLGVTAIELLPVHHFAIDRRLRDLGLTNYWGYQTLGFFAPDPRYATGVFGQQVNAFGKAKAGLGLPEEGQEAD